MIKTAIVAIRNTLPIWEDHMSRCAEWGQPCSFGSYYKGETALCDAERWSRGLEIEAEDKSELVRAGCLIINTNWRTSSVTQEPAANSAIAMLDVILAALASHNGVLGIPYLFLHTHTILCAARLFRFKHG